MFLGSILKFYLYRFLLSSSVITEDLHISVACDSRGLFLSHVMCCLCASAASRPHASSLSRNEAERHTIFMTKRREQERAIGDM